MEPKEIIKGLLNIVGFGVQDCYGDDGMEFCLICNKETVRDWAKNYTVIEHYHEPDCEFLKLNKAAEEYLQSDKG